MAGKAKQKAENGRAVRWLKYLAPALLLPVVVVGGLYAGAIFLTDPADQTPSDAKESPAAGQEAELTDRGTPQVPSEAVAPERAAIPGKKTDNGPLNLDNLRITDTIVRDGSGGEEKGFLPDNSTLPTTVKEKPKAVEETVVSKPATEPTVASGVNPSVVAEDETEPVAPKQKNADGAVPPLWLRNATTPKATKGQPMIAVVIDDLGPNFKNAHRTIALPAPLTLAFLPYANHLEDLTSKAQASGHELLLHMPMEPEESSQNPGENALLTGLEPPELERRLTWSLDRFSGYVGLNNHMGSKFTKSEPGMRLVMSELAKRGLLFLDSRTIAESRAEDAAAAFMVPFAQRDIFIDNDHQNLGSIRAQLTRLEELARRKGYAVAIGHPHNGTLEVLEKWLPEAAKRGFALVPISEIVKQQLQLARAGTALSTPQAGDLRAEP
ncbi:divergent polysaccharide deacetylase family protein [Pelagibius sp. Alg239-R121]|uniref:divergent polysaccharide deacetylase family protein n=1 Tax=Pelagibius sp. Alg239-R121 TaxID=2993448 RepID=UPI0024A7342B|nr:divergent polysaccharide deacetylase family protein [Pelagibius sp. Alg239-R121]